MRLSRTLITTLWSESTWTDSISMAETILTSLRCVSCPTLQKSTCRSKSIQMTRWGKESRESLFLNNKFNRSSLTILICSAIKICRLQPPVISEEEEISQTQISNLSFSVILRLGWTVLVGKILSNQIHFPLVPLPSNTNQMRINSCSPMMRTVQGTVLPVSESIIAAMKSTSMSRFITRNRSTTESMTRTASR